MAKKDFDNLETGRVYNDLAKATHTKGVKRTASPEVAEQRKAEMRTQGVKGAGMSRINMPFTPDNYDYIKTMSRITQMTMTQFVNYVLTQYREEHSEVYDQAKALIEKL